MSELQSPSDVADLVTLIDNWLNEFAEAGEHVLAIDRGTSDETSFGEPRWYVRLAGESKEIVTIWLTLGQRTLRYETYVMPAAIDNTRWAPPVTAAAATSAIAGGFTASTAARQVGIDSVTNTFGNSAATTCRRSAESSTTATC